MEQPEKRNIETVADSRSPVISLLPDPAAVWEWQQKLNSFGPRFTGSASHKSFINFIEEQLENRGLQVHRSGHRFTRWQAQTWSLSVPHENGTPETIPVSSYFPYSGSTGPDGICAPLVFCGKNFRGARGKIAVIEVRNIKLPSVLLFNQRKAIPKTASLPALVLNPVIGSVLSGPNLEKAQKAGVLGIICIWKGLSDEAAAGQYLPFTTGPHSCPALWAAGSARTRLRQLAKEGCMVRLVLDAVTDESAESDSLHAVLPGVNHKKTLIINTHTDGPNDCEENGSAGLLALAQAFSQIPQESRKIDIVFVFVTGHFQLPQFGINGQATTRWLHEHPELWDGKGTHAEAVAGLTIEHLGCMEWEDDKTHASCRPSGQIDRELLYTSSQLMEQILMESIEHRTKLRIVTLNPARSRYFGEGEPLYKAGIPTISLVPAPGYLCAVSDSGFIERIDKQLLYEQIQMFACIAGKILYSPSNEEN
jgi:hypothetical protein